MHVDVFLGFLSILGLSYLLFLSGLEVDLQRLRGQIMILVSSAFLISLGLALLIGFGLSTLGGVTSPLLIAIILVSTSLGVVIPILKDAGQSSTDFGQLVIAGATLGEFGSIILISLLFSSEITSPFTKVILFGFFVPVFFITSGIDCNLHALFDDFSILALVPLFLVALLLVRGVPAILYRRRLDSRHTIIAGLLQATSLTFIVAAMQIGVQLHLISSAVSAALVASGLLSAIIYPLIALILLRSIKGEEKLNEDEPILFIETM